MYFPCAFVCMISYTFSGMGVFSGRVDILFAGFERARRVGGASGSGLIVICTLAFCLSRDFRAHS